MSVKKTTPFASTVIEAYPDLRFYALGARHNLGCSPSAVFAPMTRAVFAAQTNYERRLTIERFVTATIAELGVDTARAVFVGALETTERGRAFKHKPGGTPTPRKPVAPAPVAQPADPDALPFSPSGYYVACPDGCGRLLPASGPRGVLGFASGHRPKRKRPTPLGMQHDPHPNQHPYPVAILNRPASRRLSLHAQVRRHAQLARRLSSALDAAMSVQYTRGAIGGVRSEAIGYDDPAGETAANGRRLRVSSKIRVAELALERTARVLEGCLVELEEAVDKHQGETGDDPVDDVRAAA